MNSCKRKFPWRGNRLPTPVFLGFPDGSDGKESSHNMGDLGSIPELGRSPGEGTGYPLQYSWASLMAQMVMKLSAMWEIWIQSVFSSVTQLCLTLCDPMNRSKSGLPVHHQLPEFTQTHIHRVDDAIQPSHPLSSPSPPAPNPSQHQGHFQ